MLLTNQPSNSLAVWRFVAVNAFPESQISCLNTYSAWASTCRSTLQSVAVVNTIQRIEPVATAGMRTGVLSVGHWSGSWLGCDRPRGLPCAGPVRPCSSVLHPSRHTLKRTFAHDRYTPHLETTASDPRHLFDLHAKQPVTTLNADGASSAHAREHWPLRPVVIYLHGGCGLYIWAHPACASAAACRCIQTDLHRRVNRTRPPPPRGSAAADGSGTRLAAVVTVSTGGCHAILSAMHRARHTHDQYAWQAS